MASLGLGTEKREAASRDQQQSRAILGQCKCGDMENEKESVCVHGEE